MKFLRPVFGTFSRPLVTGLRWPFLIGALVLGVFMTAFIHPQLWPLLGVMELYPHFADLVAIFAAGEAWMVGHNVYSLNPFDPFGRPHVYGPWWLAAGPLGFSVDDARWAGPLVVLAFLAAVLAVARPRGPREALPVGLLLLSPPFLLGMERANNDLIVVVLLAAAAWGIGRGSWWARGGAGLVVVAAGLKIYPLAAMTAMGATRQRLCWWTLLAAVVAMLTVFWIWRSDFAQALQLSPKPLTVFSYGFENLMFAWSFKEVRSWFALPLLGAIGVVSWPLWKARFGLWNLLPLRGGGTAACVAGACVWLTCYFATINYPYRLVVIALCLRVLLWAPAGLGKQRAGPLLLWLIIIAAHVILPKTWFFEQAQAHGERGVALLGVIIASGLEQGLWLIINTAFMVVLVGWTVRWLRDAKVSASSVG